LKLHQGEAAAVWDTGRIRVALGAYVLTLMPWLKQYRAQGRGTVDGRKKEAVMNGAGGKRSALENEVEYLKSKTRRLVSIL
jgi:hypothetical protein